MGIDNLPKSGSKFRLEKGVGNFAAKLRRASRYGELQNIRNNIPSIIGALKPYVRSIQRKKFSRLQERAALKGIKQKDSSVTKEDVRDIRKIVTHLRQNNTSSVSNTERNQTSNKTLSRTWFGFGKSREKPQPIKRDIIRAGRVNFKGEYEEDSISNRPSMVGSQQSNKSSIGVGSRLEQAKRAQTSISDLTNRNAQGIGGARSGFQTIGSNLNKK